MRLARPVADGDGRLIAGTGTQLSPSVVRALRKLAIQTVPVVESDDVASWVRTRPLADELRDLDERFARTAANAATAALRTALAGYLCKRALRLDRDAREDAAEPPPAAPNGERRAQQGRPPLDESTLRLRVAHLRSVPMLPRLFQRVVSALEDPDVDFDHVAQLIEIDQALTAQVLRVANSAFYSTQATVSRVSEALVILGTVVTRSVVLSTTVFDPSAIRLRGFFEHALGCAAAAGAPAPRA